MLVSQQQDKGGVALEWDQEHVWSCSGERSGGWPDMQCHCGAFLRDSSGGGWHRQYCSEDLQHRLEPRCHQDGRNHSRDRSDAKRDGVRRLGHKQVSQGNRMLLKDTGDWCNAGTGDCYSSSSVDCFKTVTGHCCSMETSDCCSSGTENSCRSQGRGDGCRTGMEDCWSWGAVDWQYKHQGLLQQRNRLGIVKVGRWLENRMDLCWDAVVLASGARLLREPMGLGAMETMPPFGTPRYPLKMAGQVPSKAKCLCGSWIRAGWLRTYRLQFTNLSIIDWSADWLRVV